MDNPGTRAASCTIHTTKTQQKTTKKPTEMSNTNPP
jgi:hypothetical protein